MTTPQGGMFRELEPPAGGAERFRQRLEATGESSTLRLRPLLAGGVALAALVVAVVVALRQPDVPEPLVVTILDAPELARLLGRPLEPVETRVAVNDMPVDLIQVPGTSPGIRIYEVRTN